MIPLPRFQTSFHLPIHQMIHRGASCQQQDALKHIDHHDSEGREIKALDQHFQHTQQRIDQRQQVIAADRLDKTELHVLDYQVLESLLVL